MHRTRSRIRSDSAGQRLAELRAQRPEWLAWLDLLERVLSELRAPVWARAAADIPAEAGTWGRGDADTADAGTRGHGDAGSDAPLLDGMTIRLEAKAAARWVRALLAAAKRSGDANGPLASLEPERVDALALLEAAAAQDYRRLATTAENARGSPESFAPLAQLAVMPLLHACRAQLRVPVSPRPRVAQYCPLCGAWPAFAEYRGLERSRRLRCARCGSDWSAPWLCCAFCGEKDHERIRTLVPEDALDTRKIETCASCQGALKVIATLTPLEPERIALEDLATVELDVAAAAQGFHRPHTPPRVLALRIEPAPKHGFLSLALTLPLSLTLIPTL